MTPRPDDKGARAATGVSRLVFVLVIVFSGVLFGAILTVVRELGNAVLRNFPWWALLFGPPAVSFAVSLVTLGFEAATGGEPAAGNSPNSLEDSDDYYDANPYGF